MNTQMSCYVVDDHDYYAAYSAEQAKKMHMDSCQFDEDDIDDVCLVVGSLLDTVWFDEESQEPVGSLRQWLAEATEPGWIAGTE